MTNYHLLHFFPESVETLVGILGAEGLRINMNPLIDKHENMAHYQIGLQSGTLDAAFLLAYL